MRMTELKGRAVIDPTSARKLGVVVDVLVDATAARLAAVDVAAAAAEPPERIPVDAIARIGRHAVMLTRHSPSSPWPSAAKSGSASAEDGSGEVVDHRLDYGSLVGLEVLDEGGDRVGYLQDARVDPDSLAVTAYELAGAAWRRWLRWKSEIGSAEVTSWSRELMLVRDHRRSNGADGANAGSTHGAKA